MPSPSARTAPEFSFFRSVGDLTVGTVRFALLALLVIGLTACSQRAGDLGRQNRDTFTKTFIEPIDRRLLAGGKMELSKLPQTDAEKRMYDVLWRFFSAPHASAWSPLGTPRINPNDLRTGKAFDKTDSYYAHLRRTDFQASVGRYNAMTSHISSDVVAVPAAFSAICAVQKLDAQRRIAASSLTELGADERQQVDMRIAENASAIRLFAQSLAYRYESYSYALKRLLVETPDEAARTVDANLSRLAVQAEAAERGDYCSGRDAAG